MGPVLYNLSGEIRDTVIAPLHALSKVADAPTRLVGPVSATLSPDGTYLFMVVDGVPAIDLWAALAWMWPVWTAVLTLPALVWVVRRVVAVLRHPTSVGDRYCAKCSYSLTGLPTDSPEALPRCPECGCDLRARPPRRGRRSWRRLWAPALVALVALAPWVGALPSWGVTPKVVGGARSWASEHRPWRWPRPPRPLLGLLNTREWGFTQVEAVARVALGPDGSLGEVRWDRKSREPEHTYRYLVQRDGGQRTGLYTLEPGSDAAELRANVLHRVAMIEGHYTEFESVPLLRASATDAGLVVLAQWPGHDRMGVTLLPAAPPAEAPAEIAMPETRRAEPGESAPALPVERGSPRDAVVESSGVVHALELGNDGTSAILTIAPEAGPEPRMTLRRRIALPERAVALTNYQDGRLLVVLAHGLVLAVDPESGAMRELGVARAGRGMEKIQGPIAWDLIDSPGVYEVKIAFNGRAILVLELGREPSLEDSLAIDPIFSIVPYYYVLDLGPGPPAEK